MLSPNEVQAQQGPITLPGSHAPTEGTFNLLDLRGQFGCAIDGQIVDVGPFTAVIWFEIDDVGRAVGTRTLSLNGTIIRQRGPGIYQVNPNGTGTATFTIETVGQPDVPKTTETFEFVITNDRRTHKFIATSPGVLSAGECQKVVN